MALGTEYGRILGGVDTTGCTDRSVTTPEDCMRVESDGKKLELIRGFAGCMSEEKPTARRRMNERLDDDPKSRWESINHRGFTGKRVFPGVRVRCRLLRTKIVCTRYSTVV